ncbi:unnamed protein product [Prunus armeniaca]|uniref:Uncharacterized protein n=1 Tax=Prunus armeniaca TaxID=36596 RepID=A0A6J5WCV6_PRUAR|nr:unnamed protein product [Prunus armeniaca]
MAPFSSPPRLPWGLKWWLSLVDLNKTPNTAKQIETKLQFVDLRRQVFLSISLLFLFFFFLTS